MLFELNKEKVEKQWVIPRLETALKKTEEPLNNNDIIGFLSVFFDAFSIHDDGVGLQFSDEIMLGFFSAALRRLYRNYIDDLYPFDETEEEIKDRRKKELEVFIDNLNLSELNKSVSFTDVKGDLSWLSETSIPSYCEKSFSFMKFLFDTLNKKYSEKENSLNAILLGN